MKDKSFYLQNPIARQLVGEYRESLFENEKVDGLLKKISDHALNSFKILTFDLAPKRDRKPDVLRAKLAKLADSKSVKSLTATMKDLASDNDLANPRFSEAKRLYLEALNKFTQALNRSHDINSSKDEVILKTFKLAPSSIQRVVDAIAKEEIEQKKKIAEISESINENLQEVFEGIFTGYRGRIEALKKNLTNLITSAEGKDQKSGYGRDWKRTFLDLDEMRKALDVSASGHGKKDKDDLSNLEKQVEKFQNEFNNSLVQAANRSLQNLEDDEELYSSFSDVTSLLGDGLDYLTRAYAQNKIALQEIRAEHEEEENVVAKTVFPLKFGDRDTDKKIRNSGLIYAIQTALCNGIPSAKKLITSTKGPNGIYGPSTQAVIATIQKLSGNKNTNGDLDKSLLDEIMSSDWVSQKDKQSIEKSLSVIRSKVNEGYSPVIHVDSFFGKLNEDKILLNKSEFEKELQIQYKNLAGKEKISTESINDDSESASGEGTKELAKILRQKYSLKIEADDFLKSDGSLKTSYSPEFIQAWTKAIEKISGDEDNFSYFFFSGGVYNLGISSTSLKTPSNWKKWSDLRDIDQMDDEDMVDFIKNYLNGWSTFGFIKPDLRYKGIKKLISENSDNDSIGLSNAYEMMDGAISNKEIPFIPYDILKGEISKAFRIATQKDQKSPDLGKDEFVAINNFLVMISNAVSYDGTKVISCIKWIHDNVFGESTAKRVASDAIVDKDGDDDSSGEMLGFKSNEIVTGSAENFAERKIQVSASPLDDLSGFDSLIDLNTSSSLVKKALGKNCFYISNDIYPAIKIHIRRMNASTFEDVPQKKPFKCFDTKM